MKKVTGTFIDLTGTYGVGVTYCSFFCVFSTVFRSHQDDGRVSMKGCVKLNIDC